MGEKIELTITSDSTSEEMQQAANALIDFGLGNTSMYKVTTMDESGETLRVIETSSAVVSVSESKYIELMDLYFAAKEAKEIEMLNESIEGARLAEARYKEMYGEDIFDAVRNANS